MEADLSTKQGSGKEQFIRTEMVLGRDAVNRLAGKRILVFGCGGVGGYALEALGRSGIGAIDLVDGDVVDITNLNRQLAALHSTLGRNKAEVMAARLLDINPSARINAFPFFYHSDTAERFDFSRYDYVVDAIDSVRDKLEIIQRCKETGVPVISSMGAGKKTDPTGFRVADIYATSICPLARVMRRELKKRGIEGLKVVYSTEPAAEDAAEAAPSENQDNIRKKPVGSVPWVPAAAGLLLAREVILELSRA